MKHYVQAYTVQVVSEDDPIKYILLRSVLSGQLAKWALILRQHDLVYVTQKAIKEQALADFLADHLITDDWELNEDLVREDVFFDDILPPWEMYFDGATRNDGAGVDVVLVFPKKACPHLFIHANSVVFKEHG